MDVPHCLYPFVCGSIQHLGGFHFWALWIMLLWTLAYTFLCGHAFSLLLGIHLAGEALFLNVLNILRNFQSLFPNGCITYSPAEMNGGSSFPKSLPTPLLSVLCILATLVSVKWYLRVVWTCISLMTHDLEYLLMSHLLWVRLLRRNTCSDSWTVFIWVFYFLNYKIPLCILATSPLSDVGLANIFSHSEGCLCTFLMTSFEA